MTTSKQQQWDERFVKLAFHISEWSNYPGRKVNAIIVDKRNTIKSVGYNGLPRGIESNNSSRYQEDVKYKWSEHAERNAIFSAECSLVATRMYMTWFPCVDCARAIIQTGITEIIALEPDLTDKNWGNDFKMVLELLSEAMVSIRYYDPTSYKIEEQNEVEVDDT